MRITCEDAREMGLCVAGQRRFFAAHGLDFRRFVREGFDVSEFDGIADDKLERVIAHVRAKEKGAP